MDEIVHAMEQINGGMAATTRSFMMGRRTVGDVLPHPFPPTYPGYGSALSNGVSPQGDHDVEMAKWIYAHEVAPRQARTAEADLPSLARRTRSKKKTSSSDDDEHEAHHHEYAQILLQSQSVVGGAGDQPDNS